MRLFKKKSPELPVPDRHRKMIDSSIRELDIYLGELEANRILLDARYTRRREELSKEIEEIELLLNSYRTMFAGLDPLAEFSYNEEEGEPLPSPTLHRNGEL